MSETVGRDDDGFVHPDGYPDSDVRLDLPGDDDVPPLPEEEWETMLATAPLVAGITGSEDEQPEDEQSDGRDDSDPLAGADPWSDVNGPGDASWSGGPDDRMGADDTGHPSQGSSPGPWEEGFWGG